jgi:hypothetical protein
MIRALLVAFIIALTLQAWIIERMISARDLARLTTSHVVEILATERDRTAEQAAVIAEQRAQLSEGRAADQLFRTLSQTIVKDGDVTRNALQELKKHDQAVAEYLRGAVPAVYGVQFERPETTDPAQYKPHAAMPAGGLPSAGAASSTGQ